MNIANLDTLSNVASLLAILRGYSVVGFTPPPGRSANQIVRYLRKNGCKVAACQWDGDEFNLTVSNARQALALLEQFV